MIDLVLQGKKTQTIRAWKKAPPKPGTICKLNFQVPIKIIKTYRKKLSALTIRELKQDGFSSKEDFRRIWLKCYPSFDPEQLVWIIQFQKAAA